ncbi:MAG: zinc-dependent peptidase [Bacteroidetes bacterium]|nr:MAG: zinc-dependent peptidase [Bacteroidota bacterium]
MRTVLRKLRNIFGVNHESPASTEQTIAVSDSIFDSYSFIIGSLFSYFNDLAPEGKRYFIQRVHHFKLSKKFHFIGLEESEDIAVLVSASAIQVTYGLKNYSLSHFQNIYVLADAYKMENDEELYVGHVAPEGIYLSWKHFKYGYTNRADNINVANHEMAHALLYNNFFAQYGMDTHFRMNYEQFSTTTGPILAQVITNRQSYLRSYAFSNLHEFWAVSVEAFFDNPEGLKKNMPELYSALCRVLNQDPLSKNKILKTESE